MKWDYYRPHIDRRVPGNKVDLTPLCNESEVRRNLILDLARPFRSVSLDKIASPESLGYILGSAVAQRLDKGFIPFRKGQKLPVHRRYRSRTSFVDYTNERKSLEVNRSLVKPGERILIVDDVIDTGAQVKAMIKLIERLHGEVVGVSVLVADRSRKTTRLIDKYNVHAVHMPIVR